MSIQELVPSKDICEQLKQTGFPQETCFYWYIVDDNHNVPPEIVKYYSEPKYGHYSSTDDNYTERWVAAPTAEELGRLLPEHIVIKQQLFRLTIDIDSNRRFYANYIEYKNVNTPSNTCDLSVFEHDKSVFGIYQDAFYQEGLHVGGSNKLSDVLSHMYLYLKSNNLL